MNPPSPRAGLLALVFISALAAGLAALAVAQPGSSDDLFVVLVYARNLLEHGQVCHEVADGPIEGFTSPLDLILKACALLVAPGDGVRAAWWASTICYLAAILAACRAAARWVTGPIFLLASVGLALTPGLAGGTAYHLETPLVVLALALAAPSPGGCRSPLRCMLAGVALFLVRPELGLVALVWAHPGGEVGRWRGFMMTLMALVLISLARLALFGEALPHSFFAKASDSRWQEVRDGLRYVAAFTSPGVFGVAALGHMLLLFSALYFPWLSRAFSPAARMILLSPLVCLVAVVASGGDGYEGARLLVPFTFLSLLSAIVVAGHGSRGARVGATLVLCTVCGFQVARVVHGLPAPMELWSGLHQVRALGDESFALEREGLRRLSSELPPGSVLASRHLQMAEYFEPELGFLDLTGLNDRSVTSSPAPGPVLFGRTSLEPALEQRVEAIHLHHQALSGAVLAGYSTGSLLMGEPHERDLLGAPLPDGDRAIRLAAEYRTVTLLRIGGSPFNMNLLVRADLAAGWVGREGLLVGPRD